MGVHACACLIILFIPRSVINFTENVNLSSDKFDVITIIIACSMRCIVLIKFNIKLLLVLEVYIHKEICIT